MKHHDGIRCFYGYSICIENLYTSQFLKIIKFCVYYTALLKTIYKNLAYDFYSLLLVEEKSAVRPIDMNYDNSQHKFR